MVRSLHYRQFLAPWPFNKRGQKGWRKIGPVLEEKPTWPSAQREFPELNPKWGGHNHEELQSKLFNLTFSQIFSSFSDYTGVKTVGYRDPDTKKFVTIKEMVPELIVPDLTGFTLKPYVSYKTDLEIDKR